MTTTTIITHNGQFHADEVTAIAILNIVYNNKTTIHRTRNTNQINKANIVVDVGFTYNPTTNRFDHHQANFCKYFNNNANTIVPLSSAGLVYLKYGKQMLKTITKKTISPNTLNQLYNTIYHSFIKEIDAIDNGITSYTDGLCRTNVSSIINMMNNTNVYNEQQQLVQFNKAVTYVTTTMTIIIKNKYNKLVQYNNDITNVQNAFDQRFDYTSSGEIIVMKMDCENWYKCIMECENKLKLTKNNNIKFIIYPNDSDSWRIKTIGKNFVSRKLLMNKQHLLKQLNKPIDLTFIHEKLFIGGAKTLECVVEIGQLSLLP